MIIMAREFRTRETMAKGNLRKNYSINKTFNEIIKIKFNSETL